MSSGTPLIIAQGRFASLEMAGAPKHWFELPEVRRQVLGVAGIVAAVVLWETLSRIQVLDPRFIPPPTDVLIHMWSLTLDGVLLEHFGITMFRLATGFAIGAALGIVAGFAIGLSRYARAFVYPLIAATYPIPKLALVPLILVLLGLGEESKVAIVAISAFYMLPFNIMTAVLNIEPIYIDVARNNGVGPWLFWRTIGLPSALPMIVAGLRMAWAISLIVVVGTELLVAKQGLGYMIWSASQVLDTKLMFAAFVSIAALGFVSHLVFDAISRRTLPWLPNS
jgi:NitT/TauT family transport system permease protein